MANLWVTKQGRVYNMYSTPVDPKDPNIGDFLTGTVICNSEEEFRAQFPHFTLHITDLMPKPQAPQPRPTVEQLRAVGATLDGVPQEEIAKLGNPTPATQPASTGALLASILPAIASMQSKDTQGLGVVVEDAKTQDCALIEYRLAAARKNPALPAIRKFVLKVWPNVGPELDLIEAEEKDA